MSSETQTPPVHVALLLGDPDASTGAARVHQLEVSTPVAPETVIAALDSAGVTPADARARVALLVGGQVGTRDVLVVYATIAGFIGRFPPISVGGVELNVDLASAPVGQLTRPADPAPVLVWENSLDESAVHYARRLILSENVHPIEGLGQLVRAATIRRRQAHERLPELASDVNVALAADPENSDEELTYPLDKAHAEGFKHRTSISAPVQELAPVAAPSARLNKLASAASAPIEDVLRRLGSTTDETGERWHCPRPERHTNGDKNPSMRIIEGRTRCFRCDRELVDALRLTMDAMQTSPDEAADWILSGKSR